MDTKDCRLREMATTRFFRRGRIRRSAAFQPVPLTGRHVASHKLAATTCKSRPSLLSIDAYLLPSYTIDASRRSCRSTPRATRRRHEQRLQCSRAGHLQVTRAPWTAAWSSAKRDAAVRTAASPFDTASGAAVGRGARAAADPACRAAATCAWPSPLTLGPPLTRRPVRLPLAGHLRKVLQQAVRSAGWTLDDRKGSSTETSETTSTAGWNVRLILIAAAPAVAQSSSKSKGRRDCRVWRTWSRASALSLLLGSKPRVGTMRASPYVGSVALAVAD